MKLGVDFSRLHQAVSRMKAEVTHIDLGHSQLDDLSLLRIELEKGIDVELKDVETNRGGLLGYQGHQVVLYIPDHSHWLEQAIADPRKGRKFHVADCATLQRMREQGRFERYVVRNKLSPMFPVHGQMKDGTERDNVEIPLRVCQNCLKKLNYRGFNRKRTADRLAMVESFSMEAFFATYSSYFENMPRRMAEEAGPNRYPENWDAISRAYREKVAWRCESCRVDLSDDRNLLHVHHRNGNRDDNRDSNLIVLCKDCHSKQPHHGRMFVHRHERQKIQALRKAQKLYKGPRPRSTKKTDWHDALEFADPAMHGLLDELSRQGYEVPEVGYDIANKSGRVIYSNAELAWPKHREVVVLQDEPDLEKVRHAGWTVFFPQELLDNIRGNA